MALPIVFVFPSGGTYTATLKRRSDGYRWSVAASAWEASPTLANSKITLAAGTGEYAGSYIANVSGSGDAGIIDIYIHNSSDSDKVIASVATRVIGGNELNESEQLTTVEGKVDTVGGIVDTITANVTTLINRIGAFAGSGVNTVLGFFLALMKKDASNPSDVGGTYDATTDSLEKNAENMALITVDLYTAYIEFVDDNTGTADEYSIRWRKNGVNVTSGITTPLIQVINYSGTDLIASTAMTQIGSTGAYKYTESTNRIAAGQNYEVKCTATIDGSPRTFSKIISRDS